MIIYFMFSGKDPLSDKYSHSEIDDRIKSGERPDLKSCLPDRLEEEQLLEIVERMWHEEAMRGRPSFREAHEMFRNLEDDWSDTLHYLNFEIRTDIEYL